MRTKETLDSYRGRVDNLKEYLTYYIVTVQRSQVEEAIDNKLDNLIELPDVLKIDVVLAGVTIPDWKTWNDKVNNLTHFIQLKNVFPTLYDVLVSIAPLDRVIPYAWYKELIKGLKEYNFKKEIEDMLDGLCKEYRCNGIIVKPNLLIKGYLWEEDTYE